jgi:hypothetical protein
MDQAPTRPEQHHGRVQLGQDDPKARLGDAALIEHRGDLEGAAALVSAVAGFAFSPLCSVLLIFLPAIAEPAQLIALLLVASITIQSVSL